MPSWLTIEAVPLLFGRNDLLQEQTVAVTRLVNGQEVVGKAVTFPTAALHVVVCPQGGPGCVVPFYQFREFGPGYHKLMRDPRDGRRMIPAWSLYLASPGAVVLEKNKVENRQGRMISHSVDIGPLSRTTAFRRIATLE